MATVISALAALIGVILGPSGLKDFFSTSPRAAEKADTAASDGAPIVWLNSDSPGLIKRSLPTDARGKRVQMAITAVANSDYAHGTIWVMVKNNGKPVCQSDKVIKRDRQKLDITYSCNFVASDGENNIEITADNQAANAESVRASIQLFDL